jgi:hypothetical protein
MPNVGKNAWKIGGEKVIKWSMRSFQGMCRESRMSKVLYIHCELQNIRDAKGLCGDVEA